MKKSVSILLTVGIILAANVLVQPFLLRLDLSEGRQYTLGRATKQILKDLDQQVTVTAYFSGGLPPDIGKVKRDFQDLLVEYAALSKGKLDFEFVEPISEELKQEAANLGIQPLMINVREKDQVKQQQAFMGAAIRMGSGMEVLPFVEPGASMEYNLTSSIKKLSIVKKPSVAFISGHGEPTLNELSEVVTDLGALYDITTIDLNTTPQIPDSIIAAVLLRPQAPIDPSHFQILDEYLEKGGQLVAAINSMEVDMQAAKAFPGQTGIGYWLLTKGIELDTSLVVDVQCGAVTVPQYLGMIQINTQVKFPYLPIINTFADHPTTKGLEQLILPYASPVRFVGEPGSVISFTPLLFSSSKSGIQNSPVTLRVADKNWLESDFPLSNLTLGGIWSDNTGGQTRGRMVVIGDGDFPLSGQQGRAMTKDNVNFLVNLVDWLADDSGLMDLRSKAVTSRPLKAEYLLEESYGKRQLIKWMNMGIPVLLTIVAGFVIQHRNSSLRRKRMLENCD